MADAIDHKGHDVNTGPLEPPGLIGRERERHLLDSMISGTRARAEALVICGEPGIGKSALLDYVAAAGSAASATVLRARGVESEVILPYATVADVLVPLRRLFGQLPAVQRQAIEICLGLSSAALSNQYLACVATLNLLAAAGDRHPVVVLVDDLQFVDPPSRRILLFVARHMSEERLTVVLADREGRDTHEVPSGVPRLELTGLSEAGCAALLRRHGFDTTGGLVERLRPLCGGNPLAMIELATASSAIVRGRSSSDLPDPGRYLQQAWSQRLACLPAATRKALTVVAVSRSDGTANIAAALTNSDLTLAALDPAEAAGLVRTTWQKIEFRHPVLRTVIVRLTPLAERLGAYRSLARSSSGPLHAWYLAAAAAGPDDEAARALITAATEARRLGAFDGAAAAWRRAADLTDDPHVRSTLLRNAAADAFLGGATGDAASWSEEALRHTSEPAERAEAQLLRSNICTWIGQPSTAHELLASGASELRERHPALAGTLYAAAIRPAAMDAKVTVALAYAEEAVRLSDGLPGVETSAGIAQARMLFGDVAGALALLPAVSAALASLDPIRDQHVLGLLAQCWSWADQPAEARRLATTVIEAARHSGALAGVPYALAVRGEIDTWAGRWAAAYADLTEALRWATELRQASAMGGVLAFLARLEAFRGNRARCIGHIRRARLEVGPFGIGCLEFYFNSALGSLALACGDDENAVEHLDRTFHLALDAHLGNPVVFPFAADLAEGYIRLGRRFQANEVVDWLRERAEATELAWPLAAAERCDGLLSRSVDGAEAHFQAAEAAHRRREMPFELARTRLAHGQVLRRLRRPAAARSPLEAALAVFETLGAEPWARRAAAELAAAGHPAEGRGTVGALDRLSPQELQVARAIARGMNNSEAASALFVSRKTVEAHLTRAYRKLGVRSRTDLTRLLIAAGLPD